MWRDVRWGLPPHHHFIRYFWWMLSPELSQRSSTIILMFVPFSMFGLCGFSLSLTWKVRVGIGKRWRRRPISFLKTQKGWFVPASTTWSWCFHCGDVLDYNSHRSSSACSLFWLWLCFTGFVVGCRHWISTCCFFLVTTPYVWFLFLMTVYVACSYLWFADCFPNMLRSVGLKVLSSVSVLF